MAINITSITSDQSNNQIAQADLPEVVTLTCAATDTSNPSASLTKHWFIINKPATSTATLSAKTGNSVTFSADVWGTYRVFLVVKNVATGEQSTSDVFRAPGANFIDISVVSTARQLEKPAVSERDWYNKLWKLYEVVDGLSVINNNASETVKGIVELANIGEMGTAAATGLTGASLSITPSQLKSTLDLRNSTQTAMETSFTSRWVHDAGLSDLSDIGNVATTTPTSGQALVYNTSTNVWEPGTISGGSASSAGNQFQIQIADASNGFAAAALSIDASGHLIPATTETHDIGSTSSRFRTGYFQATGGLFLGTSSLGVDSNQLKLNGTFTIPHYSGSPTTNQILKWDGSGWALDSDDSTAIPGLTSNGSNQLLIDSAYDLDPASTSVHLGSSSARFGNVYALDGNFSDDVSVGDDLTVVGEIIIQDFATINDGGSAGKIKMLAGDNSNSLVGEIKLNTDEVVCEATTASTAAKLSITDSSGDKLTLSTQTKQSSDHTILLPASPASDNDVMIATAGSSNTTSLDFARATQRVVYSTGGLTRTNVASGFSASALTHSVDSQAALYWFRNCTGNSIELKQTHVHVGSMMNATLTFCLVTCDNDTQALANTWTKVGSEFVLTNSSGSGGTLGQAEHHVSTTSTVANGEYIGLVLTNIANTSHADSMISIHFECEANCQFV
jgi:hypothetical protein